MCVAWASEAVSDAPCWRRRVKSSDEDETPDGGDGVSSTQHQVGLLENRETLKFNPGESEQSSRAREGSPVLPKDAAVVVAGSAAPGPSAGGLRQELLLLCLGCRSIERIVLVNLIRLATGRTESASAVIVIRRQRLVLDKPAREELDELVTFDELDAAALAAVSLRAGMAVLGRNRINRGLVAEGGLIEPDQQIIGRPELDWSGR